MTTQPPQTIGPYIIVREIGHGGFASVFMAHDDEHDRDVALKILDARLAGDPLFVRRFEREFSVAQGLDHPHIVKVYGYGDDAARLYIAMQLVRGADLRVRLKASGAMAAPLALQVAEQIASALDYAHAQGVIHGDVKSANILLNEDGSALLSDFGLTHALEGSAFMTTFSQSQGFMGTAEYASPEQADGKPPSAASDLYSLGVVVYEMLTGHTPFHADQPVVLLRMHAEAAPPNPLDLHADLSEALVAELLRGLQKRPADRPASATQYVTAMRNALSAEEQDGARRVIKGLDTRRIAVEQARARVAILERQRAEAERARRRADKQAQQLEDLAVETENILQSLKDEEQRAQKAAQEAEAARRLAEQRAAAAQARASNAERSMDAYQRGEVDREEHADQSASPPVAQQKSRQTRSALPPWTKWIATGIIGIALLCVGFLARGMLGSGTPISNERAISLSNSVVITLLRVPASEFLMGSTYSDKDAQSNEKPQHKVTLDEYWIGKTEVTNAQYGAYAQAKGLGWSMPTGKENHPVVSVSWDDAVAFCAWVSEISGKQVRLPTEAEWEKAARGDDGDWYPWGNQSPDPNRLNFNNNVNDTTEVWKYSPAGDSPYGAMDMAGNVWEWVADWYADGYYATSPASNPTGPATGQYRVLRGGSWSDLQYLARAVYRNGLSPDYRSSSIGFRVVSAPVP